MESTVDDEDQDNGEDSDVPLDLNLMEDTVDDEDKDSRESPTRLTFLKQPHRFYFQLERHINRHLKSGKFNLIYYIFNRGRPRQMQMESLRLK